MILTPLRLAREAAIPTEAEVAARLANRWRARHHPGRKGITGVELVARMRALGGHASAAEVSRWEKPPGNVGAVRPSTGTKALLERALGLEEGSLSRPLCPACKGTGLAPTRSP